MALRCGTMVTEYRASKNISRPQGFSLVELLAVVLILTVLGGIAIPVYLQERQKAAARTCLYNLKVIAGAQSAYALRFGTFCLDTTTSRSNSKSSNSPNSNANSNATKNKGTTYYAVSVGYIASASTSDAPTGGLLGAPEGLASPLTCPLDGSVYTCTSDDGGTTLTIKCPNGDAHAAVFGSMGPSSWQRTMKMSSE
jgi:prepilin-type N-terminal cleavage/methylation domain-containing protein